MIYLIFMIAEKEWLREDLSHRVADVASLTT
jgi:hypothetical protein